MVDRSAVFVNSAVRYLSLNPNVDVVGHCSSAQDALQVSRELAPDLVLMDLAMRRGSALDLTRRMKALNPGGKVVLLGLHDNVQYLRAATQAGADAFLPKWDFAGRLWPVLSGLFDDRFSGEANDRHVRGARDGGSRVTRRDPSSLRQQ
jgi:DNA-binding NarL/FixJ family response regulator